MPYTFITATAAVVLACALTSVASAAAPAALPADGESCKGTLEIDGKTYELKYAVAYACKVFDSEDAISVIFSDSKIPVEKLRASLRETGSDGKFFHFKPQVTVTFDKAGKPMFCNGWADNNSVSVSGPSLSGKLDVKDGKARGETALTADADSKRKSVFTVSSFDLTLLVVPKEKAAEEAKPDAKPAEEKKPKDDAAPAPAVISAKKLALPEGATDVTYKKPVEQITAKCPADIKKTAEELSKKLAEQGWKTDGSDLVGPASAILKRKRGDATLTAFVKPPTGKDTGSTLMIMSKGLAWNGDDDKKS